MRNSFNLLLIALACFDNVFLFSGVLEALRKNFGLVTKVMKKVGLENSNQILLRSSVCSEHHAARPSFSAVI